MPYMRDGKRDYERQGRLVDSKPEARQHRAENVKQNRELEKKGIGHKGDGKDAAHIKPFSKGGGASASNTKLVDENKNRSFKRNSDGSMK